MHRWTVATIGAALAYLALAASGAHAADPRVADIAQAGKLRAALFLPQYTKDAATGELRGSGTGIVAIEVARQLAARIGVAADLVGYPSPAAVVDCLKAGTCDIAFMGIEPDRVAELDFAPPVIQFDYTYLVPAGSALRNAADADRAGVRIAYVAHHAAALALTRVVTHAELVAAELPDAAFDLLRSGTVDAFALARPQLLGFAAKLPGSRILDGGYGINRLGIATRKGEPGHLAAIGEFVEDAKASGAIARAVEHSGLRGIAPAPPGPAGTQ
jgi:polar amino acid transport system substrate-binding protein